MMKIEDANGSEREFKTKAHLQDFHVEPKKEFEKKFE